MAERLRRLPWAVPNGQIIASMWIWQAGIHEIAAAFLNDAVIGKEDRNLYLDRFTINSPAGTAEPVLVNKQELAEAAEKREQEIVAATQSAIEKNRKADAKVRIVDAAGRAMPGVKVSIEQVSHEFLFGCNIYMFDHCKADAENAAYKKRFADLFNYATVGFYWRWYEPRRGRPNYRYTDKVVAWCREHGIRMKGHPLLWGDEAGVPFWSHGQPSAEIQRQRVEEIIHRYHDKIEFWEVVNEPSHLAEPKIDQPYRWARLADPRACLIVNDYYVLGRRRSRILQAADRGEAERRAIRRYRHPGPRAAIHAVPARTRYRRFSTSTPRWAKA